MRSVLTGNHAGRSIVCVIAVSLLLSACRADAVTGFDASCTDQPGCDTLSETLSPHVLSALDDAGTRLTSSLSTSLASALVDRLDQLEAALVKREMYAGRIALAATYDVLAHAERNVPDARPDIDAIRLALIPAARALGVFSADAFSVVSQVSQ